MSGDVDDFNFYLQFTKPIVLNLPDAKDRAIAALWLKKLADINEGNPESGLHVEYLKLLLFAAQKRKLGGIFKKSPPEGSLEPFPQHHTVLDMMQLVKSTEIKDTSLPPIHVSASADLCEFVSIQEIPNFGIHGYYAISTEPLTKWMRPKTGEPVRHVPCYKDTCKLSKLSNYNKQDANTDGQPLDAIQHTEPAVPEIFVEDLDISLLPQLHSKIELPFLENRPCWGTNRYIERLIDQSPHFVGDLDLSEADAVLHLFKEKRMKPGKKGGPCLLPSKRRQVEKLLDLPPCTDDPGDTESSSEEDLDIHSCLPKCEDHTDLSWTDYCILNREKQAVQTPVDPCLPKSTFSKHQKKTEYPKSSRHFPKQPKHTGQRKLHDKINGHKDGDTVKLQKIMGDSDIHYSDWITDVPSTGITQSFPFPPRIHADTDSEKHVLPETFDFEVSERDRSKLPRSSPVTPSFLSPSMLARPPALSHQPVPPLSLPLAHSTPQPLHIASRPRASPTNLPETKNSVRHAELQISCVQQPFTPHEAKQQSVNCTHFISTLCENIPADQSGFISLRTGNQERLQFAPEDSYLPQVLHENGQNSLQGNSQLRPSTLSFECSGRLRLDEHFPDASSFTTLQTAYRSEAEIVPEDSYYPENAESYAAAFYEGSRAASSDWFRQNNRSAYK